MQEMSGAWSKGQTAKDDVVVWDVRYVLLRLRCPKAGLVGVYGMSDISCREAARHSVLHVATLMCHFVS